MSSDTPFRLNVYQYTLLLNEYPAIAGPLTKSALLVTPLEDVADMQEYVS